MRLVGTLRFAHQSAHCRAIFKSGLSIVIASDSEAIQNNEGSWIASSLRSSQ
jgi:hypothetical protein